MSGVAEAAAHAWCESISLFVDDDPRTRQPVGTRMHKDPPPSFFERPLRRLVVEGMITGLIASVIVVGVWALTASSGPPRSLESLPMARERP
jgi:hypothetical protein